MTLHFDTNELIQISFTTSDLGAILLPWLKKGNIAAVSTITWSEFCNGPVTNTQKNVISSILSGNIIDFTKPMAETASFLFNSTGRRRGSHPDCMIAACAILSGAPLCTKNLKDFNRFVPFGLRLHSF
ncbi:MAG: PIN domain-containing protein [Akkermansiaceae bacterium]|jgi:predicted nucleic acid-binding protein|nr:PIN domain-containing protein [Luteolibacter sp.]